MTKLSESNSLSPEASDLLKKYAGKSHSQLVGEIEVRPNEQTHMSLGTFQEDQHPKGFTIEPLPAPPEDDAIVARIVRLNQASAAYELVLHVANYSNTTIDVEIRELA